MPLFTSCLLLTTALLAIFAGATETGLAELQSRDNICSEQVLRYTCVTAGRGATEVTLDNVTLPNLEFSHARYADGANVNQSSPDGYVMAGNLSRSQTEECFDELGNSTSFCYRTIIRVRLTEQTRCKVIGCRTRVRINDEDKLFNFGNAALTRVSPAPNLHDITQLVDAVTFAWSVNCSNVHYRVSTSSCGTCDPIINTTDTNITCRGLDPGKQCKVSIQSSLECAAFSLPVTETFEAPHTTTEETTTQKIGNNIGLIVGISITCIFLLMAIIVGVILVIRFCRYRRKLTVSRSDTGDEQENRDQNNGVPVQRNTQAKGQLEAPSSGNVVSQEQGEEEHDIHLDPISSRDPATAVTTVTQPSSVKKMDTTQSPVEPEEDSAENIHKHQAMIVNNATTNDLLNHDNEFPPTSITRGMEEGLISTLKSFNEPMGPDKERKPHESECTENGYGHDLKVQSYGCSDGGKLVAQVVSRNNSGNEVPSSIPVAVSDIGSGPSQTVGINGSGVSKVSNIKKSSAETGDLFERMKTVENTQKEQGEKIAQQDVKIDEQEEKIRQQNAKIDDLQAKIFDLTQDVEKNRKKYEELKMKSSEEQILHREEMERLQAKIEALEKELEKTEADLKNAHKTSRSLKEELERTKADLKSANKKLEMSQNLESRYRELETEVEVLKDEKDTLKEQKDTLKKEKDTLKKALQHSLDSGTPEPKEKSEGFRRLQSCPNQLS